MKARETMVYDFLEEIVSLVDARGRVKSYRGYDHYQMPFVEKRSARDGDYV